MGYFTYEGKIKEGARLYKNINLDEYIENNKYNFVSYTKADIDSEIAILNIDGEYMYCHENDIEERKSKYIVTEKVNSPSDILGFSGEYVGDPIYVYIEKKQGMNNNLYISLFGKTKEYKDVSDTKNIEIDEELLKGYYSDNEIDIKITLCSYNEDGIIGTRRKTYKLKFKSENRPIIEKVILKPYPSKLSKYYKRISALDYEIRARAMDGAKIDSITVCIGDERISGEKGTSQNFLINGYQDVDITVIDSKGRASTKKEQIEILDYEYPYIDKPYFTRCNEDGTYNMNGECVKLLGEVKSFYDDATVLVSVDGNIISGTNGIYKGFKKEKAYDIKCSVMDRFSEFSFIYNLAPSACIFSIADGSFCIGNEAKVGGGFDVNMKLGENIKNSIIDIVNKNIIDSKRDTCGVYINKNNNWENLYTVISNEPNYTNVYLENDRLFIIHRKIGKIENGLFYISFYEYDYEEFLNIIKASLYLKKGEHKVLLPSCYVKYSVSNKDILVESEKYDDYDIYAFIIYERGEKIE